MRLSKVLLAVLALGCGGGGGDGNPTGTTGGPGTGTGTGPGTGTGSPSASATVSTKSSDDGYGTATYSFSPATVSVQRGGTVTWSNEGNVVHNVTFNGASGAPANIPNFSGSSATRTFTTSGSFSYQCTNHPGMNGAVTVP